MEWIWAIIGFVLCVVAIVAFRFSQDRLDEWWDNKASGMRSRQESISGAIFRIEASITQLRETQELHANKIYARGDVVTNKEFDIWSERIVAIEEELDKIPREERIVALEKHIGTYNWEAADREP